MKEYFVEYPSDSQVPLYQVRADAPGWLREALADAFVYDEMTPWATKAARDMAGILDDRKVVKEEDIVGISLEYFKRNPGEVESFYEMKDGSFEEKQLYDMGFDIADDPWLRAHLEAVYIIAYSLWAAKAAE